MNFYCNGCNSERSFENDYSILIISIKKEVIRYCKDCRFPKALVPDVYWDGKPEEGLADDPNTGKPIVFLSKGQKASYLKQRGLQEAGDRYHGSYVESSKNQIPKSDSRHEVQMALKKVKEMGRDYRRQEYLRIQKEGGQYAR